MKTSDYSFSLPRMSRHAAKLMLSTLLCSGMAACGSRSIDLTPPVIEDTDFLPADCDIYYAGETLEVRFTCSDDTELGNFNIEVHNNFDHHTHGTSSGDCPQTEENGGVEHAWIFNQDYAIPPKNKEYTAVIQLPIPAYAAAGDYHFMLRLTDEAGWQTLKAVAIRIVPADSLP